MDALQKCAAPGGAATGTFAALCCAGVPGAAGLLSAAGVGFLYNDLFLLPLLALSIGITLWALRKGVERRADPRPFRLGVVASIGLAVGIFLGPWVVGVAALALIVASVWNLLPAAR